jgi:hypothetical protein
MKHVYLLLFLLFISSTTFSQVVINEYSCSNISGPTDAYGDREDWVELYNTSASAVNLTGYFLSDKPTSTNGKFHLVPLQETEK